RTDGDRNGGLGARQRNHRRITHRFTKPWSGDLRSCGRFGVVPFAGRNRIAVGTESKRSEARHGVVRVRSASLATATETAETKSVVTGGSNLNRPSHAHG